MTKHPAPRYMRKRNECICPPKDKYKNVCNSTLHDNSKQKTTKFRTNK